MFSKEACLTPKDPFVVRQFFEPGILHKLQLLTSKLKNPKNAFLDDTYYMRYAAHNQPLVDLLHSEVVAKRTFELFGEKLKPSYSFVAMYLTGKGIVPIHVDREQCYLTVDVCINQKEVWPIYVNHKETFNNERDNDLRERLRNGSDKYLLNPGDAVCYSGTMHPHYRDRIQEGNWCDLAFFHFVKEDFQGSLD